MDELQALRDELDVDEAAGDLLEVPDRPSPFSAAISRRISRTSALTFAASRGRDRTAVTIAVDLRGKGCVAGDRRGPASAPCAPRSRLRCSDSPRSLSTGRRRGPCGRRVAGACRRRRASPAPVGAASAAIRRCVRRENHTAGAIGRPSERSRARRVVIVDEMRSRSDVAVISRPPSLPIATSATRPPGDVPCTARTRW